MNCAAQLFGSAPVTGVCRARHMFLKVRQMYLIFKHLASLRPSVSKIPPSGMEASWSETETRAKGERECSERQRRSGMATGYPARSGMLRKEAALPRRGTAKVRDDEQKPSMRRTRRDEPAPQGKVLYPSQGVSVNSAFVYRKTCVYPGRSATMSTNGLTEP